MTRDESIKLINHHRRLGAVSARAAMRFINTLNTFMTPFKPNIMQVQDFHRNPNYTKVFYTEANHLPHKQGYVLTTAPGTHTHHKNKELANDALNSWLRR